MGHTPLNLIPRPESCVVTEGAFSLGPGTTVAEAPEAAGAAAQVRALLCPATGFALPPSGRERGNVIVLAIDREDRGLGDEGYRLVVTPDVVELRAARRAGLGNAIQTLRQLLPPGILGSEVVRGCQWTVPCAEITDRPRFAWRGAHLDVARHYLPTRFLLRYVDLLALHKLNVLHLHLTDDQGWRMEIRRYPRLTGIGAWRSQSMVGDPAELRFDGVPHGGYYTQAELATVVAHAASRGITVIPEIDMPGHCQAAIAAYPELGCPPGRPVQVATAWALPVELLNTEDSTVAFFRNVLAEVVEVFPSPFIHVGGDECPTQRWREDPRAQARMRALGLSSEAGLQNWFISQMGGFLSEAGRRMVGWDEIVDGGLAPGAVVMCWRGEACEVAAARAGHDVVMASQEYTYLDWAQSADPAEPVAFGKPDTHVTPVEKVYGYEPVPAALSAEEARHVIGTQCQLWTEHVATPEHVEYMAFPRVCALAEVAWSPQGRNWDDFLSRLRGHLRRLDAAGVSYHPIEGPVRPPAGAVLRSQPEGPHST
jgi:hexosaminidase